MDREKLLIGLPENPRPPPNSKLCARNAHSNLVFLHFPRLSDLSLFRFLFTSVRSPLSRPPGPPTTNALSALPSTYRNEFAGLPCLRFPIRLSDDRQRAMSTWKAQRLERTCVEWLHEISFT